MSLSVKPAAINTHYTTARSAVQSASAVLQSVFGGLCRHACDAVYLDASCATVIGVSGLPHWMPVMQTLLQNRDVLRLLPIDNRSDLLLAFDGEQALVSAYIAQADQPAQPDRPIGPLALPDGLSDTLVALCQAAGAWAGSLDAQGRSVLDPRCPMPGPHYGVNLLMGDRTGFDHPLQTTPKSVVDVLGRGSFRSHAATQVLATRWDLRQEENGFPANRQFYLTEDGQQVFYSAQVNSTLDSTVVSARCTHAPNLTTITTHTRCGLSIGREIFLAAQEDASLPLACEVQQITLVNQGSTPRTLRLVYTGMFGPSKPPALMEDVLYSNIIMQAGLLRTDDGAVLALAPDYCPVQDQNDLRFQVLAVHDGLSRTFPREFCTDYREFVGQGTLERPDSVARLSNRLSRKGPGFFALAVPIHLAPGQTVTMTSLTGLVSARSTDGFGRHSLADQVTALLARYDSPQAVQQAIQMRQQAFERHCAYLRFSTGSERFDSWANQNLPFQVYYQTFVSRSFDQTQKGYREIGFREVQDLFASMAPFCAEGRSDLVEDLLGQWAAQVHEFGFANHNFYWVGKEPGLWSDDALWLIQAVSRYVDLTGQTDFLTRQVSVAGSKALTRPLIDTLAAIVRYSGLVSVGQHGLPLLDRADWNDCLKVDTTHPDGPAKQAAWQTGQRSPSDGTESVMNAFLLKLAADELARLALSVDKKSIASLAQTVSSDVTAACQTHAWKDTWFARLLVNRPCDHPVVGAPGDGLATDGSSGSLFINSFSWAVLSGVASEAQIASMYALLESRLKTPHGYRLVTAHDLRRVEPSVASAEYFAGDRENGAVFKHASLMAVVALFQAASQVTDPALASAMSASAWQMIDLAAPYRTLDNPFVLAGNPRFCTQYNNSETGDNIGPLLSGTASWSTLAVRRGFGIDFCHLGLRLDPLLRTTDTEVRIDLQWQTETYQVTYRKPLGFVRALDQTPTLTVDGQVRPLGIIPRVGPGAVCRIMLVWS